MRGGNGEFSESILDSIGFNGGRGRGSVFGESILDSTGDGDVRVGIGGFAESTLDSMGYGVGRERGGVFNESVLDSIIMEHLNFKGKYYVFTKWSPEGMTLMPNIMYLEYIQLIQVFIGKEIMDIMYFD